MERYERTALGSSHHVDPSFADAAAQAFSRAPLAMAMIDLAGRCLWINDTAERIFGYSASELVGKTLAEVTFDEDAEDDEILFAEAAAGHIAAWERVKRVTTGDASLAWIHARYWVARDDDDSPAFVVSQVARLTEHQALLHEAIRQLADAVVAETPGPGGHGGEATDEAAARSATVLTADPDAAGLARMSQTRLLPGWPPATTAAAAAGLSAAVSVAAPAAAPTRGVDAYTVTLYEAAQLLNVSGSTLRRWADSGRLSCVRTAGGHRRFRLADIQRLRTERHQPSEVRMQAYPARPLPFVAATIERSANELATRASRCLYIGPPGWFEQPDSAGPVRALLSSLARAFASGDFHEAQGTVRQLMHQAELGGASLAERHAFIQTLDAVLRRQLRELGCPRIEQAGAAQAAAAMTYQLIADHDRELSRH